MKQGRIIYVLDPYSATLATVTIPDNDESGAYRRIIGSDGVDRVQFDRNHSLYFDDEGLADGIITEDSDVSVFLALAGDSKDAAILFKLASDGGCM